MAIRPVFIPVCRGPQLVRELNVDFIWYSGQSVTQKRKSANSLHGAVREAGFSNPLEVSTKSDDPVGQAMSAFKLDISIGDGRVARVEVVYQAAKVFKFGGPYSDLLSREPAEAKRDPRLQNSGPLVGFSYLGRQFPLLPKRAFYDWLYVRALVGLPALVERLISYDAFTDIEFNPAKSLNTQAHAVAAVVALAQRDWLHRAARSFNGFARVLSWSEADDVSADVPLPLDA